MSRPNDGQSLFPSFGNPFRMVSSNRLSDQFAKLNQILNAFETSLTRILKKLEPNILKDKINLSWVQQARGFYLLYTRTSSPLLQISNSLQQNGMRNGRTNTWITLWRLVKWQVVLCQRFSPRVEGKKIDLKGKKNIV
jgi:hypothetical protein